MNTEASIEPQKQVDVIIDEKNLCSRDIDAALAVLKKIQQEKMNCDGVTVYAETDKILLNDIEHNRSFQNLLQFCKDNKIKILGIDRNKNMSENLKILKEKMLKENQLPAITIVGYNPADESKKIESSNSIFCMSMENPDIDKLQTYLTPILIKDEEDIIWVCGCGGDGKLKLEKLYNLKEGELKEMRQAIFELTRSDAFKECPKEILADKVAPIIQNVIFRIQQEGFVTVQGLFSKLNTQPGLCFWVCEDKAEFQHFKFLLKDCFSEALILDSPLKENSGEKHYFCIAVKSEQCRMVDRISIEKFLMATKNETHRYPVIKDSGVNVFKTKEEAIENLKEKFDEKTIKEGGIGKGFILELSKIPKEYQEIVNYTNRIIEFRRDKSEKIFEILLENIPSQSSNSSVRQQSHV